MLQDNPYALKRGITVSREPSAPSAPPAQDGGDDDVLELRAALKLAQRVLERYRSDLKQRDAELKQKAAELKQTEDVLKQTSISYAAQHKTLKLTDDKFKEYKEWYKLLHDDWLQLKEKEDASSCAIRTLQDKVKYLQKHVDERTTELAKLDEENVSLRYELFNTKAEVEKLQERMRS